MDGLIATITLNPSLDRYINVRGFKIDQVNRWTSVRIYAGGKGIDVSRAIHRMGGRTIAYGFVGGPDGRAMEILLDEEGVPFSFTPIHRETRTNYILTDTKSGTQTRIDAPGPRISRRELERFMSKVRHIRPTPDLLAIGGSLPPGLPADFYRTIITEVKSFGIKTILDVDNPWLREGIKARPYLIKPNVEEAEGLLGRPLATEKAVVGAARELVAMGIEIVIISRGKDGLVVADADQVLRVTTPPVKVRSAVGAGDCTVAGFALKLADEEPLVVAARLGAAMGTAAVLSPGTELARKADVEKLLPQVEIEDITRG